MTKAPFVEPKDLMKIMMTLTVPGIRKQMEKDRANRISRYILVSEFIHDAMHESIKDEASP